EEVVAKAESIRPTYYNLFGDAASRVSFRTTDIFDISNIPKSADTYMLKNIVHDWSDDQCDSLLQNISHVFDGNYEKRVLVVEKIVNTTKISPRTAGHDIVKCVLFDDQVKHRTLDSFSKMFLRNGFEVTKITPLLDTDYYAIEGKLLKRSRCRFQTTNLEHL
ncbi:isoflavone 7-O-methyltransferase, partial [Acrasis kona]